jgi:hypothetical protein
VSHWSSTPAPISPATYFKEGDRVTLHEDLIGNEQFDARCLAPIGEEATTGIVVFALPPHRGTHEQRCVLVAREGDCSYQKAFFFRAAHLKHADQPCVYQRGDRVKLSRSAPATGCIAHYDTYVDCFSTMRFCNISSGTVLLPALAASVTVFKETFL